MLFDSMILAQLQICNRGNDKICCIECAPMGLIVDEPPMPNKATMLVLNEMCSINGLGAGAQTLIIGRTKKKPFFTFQRWKHFNN